MLLARVVAFVSLTGKTVADVYDGAQNLGLSTTDQEMLQARAAIFVSSAEKTVADNYGCDDV